MVSHAYLRSLPSLFFMHQPFLQYNDLYHKFNTYGSRKETSGCSTYNTGLYSAIRELGNVHSVYIGHDHNNDFHGQLNGGPTLFYGRKTGFGSYGPDFDIQRGARVVQMSQSGDPVSWIRTPLGVEPLQELHKPNPNGFLPCGASDGTGVVYIILPVLLLLSVFGFAVFLCRKPIAHRIRQTYEPLNC